MNNKRESYLFSTKNIAQSAIIAALYVVLTVAFAPISFGAVQLRIAEALTILPFFTPAAIPGLFVGCILGNLLGGAILIDIIFGSIATLIGAFFGYVLRHNKWLVPIPTVISNTLIIPFILKYGYGLDVPLALQFVYIFAGEVAGSYILGELLGFVLEKRKGIFGAEK